MNKTFSKKITLTGLIFTTQFLTCKIVNGEGLVSTITIMGMIGLVLAKM